MRLTQSREIAVDTWEIVVSTLAEAAKLAPVPYLQDAAGQALRISEITQVWMLYFSHHVDPHN